MYQFILLIHVFAAVIIIALVLLQQGKGATVGAAFGSGASSTVFGSRGSGSFLFRITMSFGAIFFLSSLGLNYLAARAYKQEKVITIPVSSVKQQKETSESTAAVPSQKSVVPPQLPAEIPTR